MSMFRTVAAVLLACVLSPTLVGGGQSNASGPRWVTTWATASVARAVAPPEPGTAAAPAGPPPAPRFSNQTLRQTVHVSAGGNRMRVVLSNAFGTGPLLVGAVHVSVKADTGAPTPAPAVPVAFSGRTSVSVPPGAVLISDALALRVPPLADVIVDMYFPGDVTAAIGPLTTHTGALQTNHISSGGNHAGMASFPAAATSTAWFFLARVEIEAAHGAAVVAVLGDSITDGARSTVDANSRWPDHLARRAQAQGRTLGVVNAGIAGNRLLADGAGVNALARFERDVLAHPGVTHLIVMHGINDVGRGASADDVVAAHEQVVRRARAHGLRVIGVTLTPIEDAVFPGYFTPANEATRQAVNAWIRTSGTYDGVIDADAVLRDPMRLTRLRAEYASPDYIHPNDAGYGALAAAVDLGMLVPVGTAAGRP